MVIDGLHFDDPRHDGYVNQLPDIDPGETSEWLDSLEAVVETHGKTRARYLISKLLARANELQVGLAGCHLDAVHQHHPRRAGALVPGRRARRAPHPLLHPLERGRHGRAGQQEGRRHRRAPRHLRLVRRAVRGRLQPLLPRQGGRHARRPRVLPGPRRTGHLRPRLPRGPPRRRPARQLPHGGRGRGHLQLPPPPAHAGLLGVPHRLDGPRPDQLDLPGPVPQVPDQPAGRRHQRLTRCGASSATARPTSPSPSARSRSPRARASTTSSGS